MNDVVERDDGSLQWLLDDLLLKGKLHNEDVFDILDRISAEHSRQKDALTWIRDNSPGGAEGSFAVSAYDHAINALT